MIQFVSYEETFVYLALSESMLNEMISEAVVPVVTRMFKSIHVFQQFKDMRSFCVTLLLVSIHVYSEHSSSVLKGS
jgi:hypothetical protein